MQKKNGLRRRNNLIRKSYILLNRFIEGQIIYNMLDEQEWTKFINKDDNMIKAAMKVINRKATFPNPPMKMMRVTRH